MKSLSNYLKEDQEIQEGLIGNMINAAMIGRIDQEYLATGILNMYEYICDKSNIDKMYQDYPLKERFFWKSIYNLYQKKCFSIIDVSNRIDVADMIFGNNKRNRPVSAPVQEQPTRQNFRDRLNNAKNAFMSKDSIVKRDDDFDNQVTDKDFNISSDEEDTNKLIVVTPAFRRNLRKIIQQSRNRDLPINASDPKLMIVIDDPQFSDQKFVFTINKQTGLFRKIGNLSSEMFLKKMLTKLAGEDE